MAKRRAYTWQLKGGQWWRRSTTPYSMTLSIPSQVVYSSATTAEVNVNYVVQSSLFDMPGPKVP